MGCKEESTEDEDDDVVDLSAIDWVGVGSIIFDKAENSSEDALRTLFCDERGQFVMLRIHQPHKRPKNQDGQVREVSFFGFATSSEPDLRTNVAQEGRFTVPATNNPVKNAFRDLPRSRNAERGRTLTFPSLPSILILLG